MLIKEPKTGLRHWAKGLCAAFCLLSVAYSFAIAGEAAPAAKSKSAKPFEPNKNEPIFITSDRMEVDRKKNTIVYDGRVVTRQGEATIKSEKLIAAYSADMKEIREVVAEGNVHITQGDRVATGNRAVFDGKKQTITLTGNPVIRQGNSELSGSRITFFIEQDRAVAEGRVKATIFPEELKKSEQRDSGPGKEK